MVAAHFAVQVKGDRSSQGMASHLNERGFVDAVVICTGWGAGGGTIRSI